MDDQSPQQESSPVEESDEFAKRDGDIERDDSPDEKRSPTGRSVDADLRSLKSVLERTGRDLRRPVLVEGALWYGALMMAVVLSALFVAGFVPDYGYAVGRWILVIGGGLATAAAASALVYGVWHSPSPVDVAMRVQRHCSDFRSDLVAALEFGDELVERGGADLEKEGVSPAMARAHVGRTLRKVHDAAQEHSLAHVVPGRDLIPAVVTFSAGVVLLLIPLFLNPGWTLGVLSGERIGAPVVGERVVEDAIVGSVEGIFVYPAYTGRDRQLRRLGTGRIESLEGTEVHLHATMMPGHWSSVELVVETESDDEPRVIEMSFDRQFRATATLTLEEDGYYWFRAQTIEGRPVEDPARRPIRVTEDPPPTVEITSHQGRVEVEPDEVVEFDVEVSDQFGIDAVERIHHFQAAPDNDERKRIQTAELSGQPRTAEFSSTFDLTPLDLQPKDAVVVYFEARDVNSATGPGRGESSSVVLYVESPEDRHLENIGRQQEMMEALFSHLGDVLEAPVGERELENDGSYRQRIDTSTGDETRHADYRRTHGLHERRSELLVGMAELAEVLEDDPVMAPRTLTMFNGVRQRLEGLQDDGDAVFDRLEDRADRRDLTAAHHQEIADYQAEAEAELERGVLELEDLLVSQKMELVERTADDIEQMRDRLRDLLEQYRDTDDPELREAIEREIQRMRQRMRELMSRMQMMMREMPREHVNLEAMEDMEMQSQAQQLGEQLDRIDDLLADDDIDGALEALDEMELGLEDFTGEMEDSFQQMQPQGVSEFDEAIGEMMDEVGILEEWEREVEQQTRELREELREQRQEQLEQMMEPIVDELLREVQQQKRDRERIDRRELLDRDREQLDLVGDSLESLREMLEQRDMEQSLDRARRSNDALRSLRSSLRLSQRYSDLGDQLEQSVTESGEMLERGRHIEERLEEFMEQAAEDLDSGEEQQFDELAEEQQEIGERAGELRETIEEYAQEYPQLEEQLQPTVEEAEQAMQQAEEGLRERSIQQALDEERRAIEQLHQLGESMGQALRQQRQQEREEGQGRGAHRDEVEIPGEEGDDARRSIREEMMEGMREGRLEEYESELERYFRSLVE